MFNSYIYKQLLNITEWREMLWPSDSEDSFFEYVSLIIIFKTVFLHIFTMY